MFREYGNEAAAKADEAVFQRFTRSLVHREKRILNLHGDDLPTFRAWRFWSDRYFVRTVSDKISAAIMLKYVEYQTHEDNSIQPSMLE